MEAYKHSCPFCGQHIEYTEGYCGQQMACPICGKTVTFPAIPSGGRRSTLRLKRDAGPQREKWSFDLKKIWAALCNFEHWHIVRLSLVPFAIVAGQRHPGQSPGASRHQCGPRPTIFLDAAR